MQAVLYTTPPLATHLPGLTGTGHRNYWAIIQYILQNSLSQEVIPFLLLYLLL